MPITISINSGADFEPVSEGVHQAVLADIVDLGIQETAFGPKEKVQLIWLSDEADPETGKTKYIFKRYNRSLHEKADLRKDVEKILGRPIPGDVKSFDIETLLGTTNQLVIQHSEGKNGKTYGNVIGILKAKGGHLAIPADFTRKKDKAPSNFSSQRTSPATGGRAAAAAVLAPAGAFKATNDDVGF